MKRRKVRPGLTQWPRTQSRSNCQWSLLRNIPELKAEGFSISPGIYECVAKGRWETFPSNRRGPAKVKWRWSTRVKAKARWRRSCCSVQKSARQQATVGKRGDGILKQQERQFAHWHPPDQSFLWINFHHKDSITNQSCSTRWIWADHTYCKKTIKYL